MCVVFHYGPHDGLKKHSPLSKANSSSAAQKLAAWNTRSLLCSQHPATGSYSESDKSGSTAATLLCVFIRLFLCYSLKYINCIFYDKAAHQSPTSSAEVGVGGAIPPSHLCACIGMSRGDLHLYIFYERQIKNVNILNFRNEFVAHTLSVLTALALRWTYALNTKF